MKLTAQSLRQMKAATAPVTRQLNIGLTPQTSKDFKQVGRSDADAQRVFDEAVEIADAGAFMVVLEHIPATLAERITKALTIPTIGIGAGAACDGHKKLTVR
jgi:3-methyl-2-oxobutanoate hydroxymethyltransferase